jgi:hypothetical protein
MSPDANFDLSPTGEPEASTPLASESLDPMIEQVVEWFTYHRPTQEQLLIYHELREAAGAFALSIVNLVPPGPDRTAALRKVREAVMTANAGIACRDLVSPSRKGPKT